MAAAKPAVASPAPAAARPFGAAAAAVPAGAAPIAPAYVPPAQDYEDDEDEVEELMRPEKGVGPLRQVRCAHCFPWTQREGDASRCHRIRAGVALAVVETGVCIDTVATGSSRRESIADPETLVPV